MTQPSNQRILANDRNLVRDAALTPSSVKPIANAVMTLPQFRSGNGQVKVSGTYTGTDDATYDVEIVDNIATLPIISKPTFKGSGNGTLAALTATGLAAQTITLTLGDIGLAELAAQTEFEGVTLRARTTGPGGNALHIHVDNSPLVFSDTQFSTIEDIKAGATDGLKGAQFDWDTKVLGGKRAIPANAHRVAFGNDTNHIYLHWKEWKKDAWIYGFTPAITADVAKGSKVKFVSAGRTVTVSDGTTTETYTNVVSIYDFLNAVKTASALVEITGAVANDRAPGGQASIEFKLRTDAYAVANAGSNKLASGGFETVTIGALANTEVIEARCIAANAKDRATAGVGSEIWALNGSVSGALGEIVSGSTYVEPSLPSKFALRVPHRVPDGFDKPRGKFSVASIDYASRATSETKPPICPVALALGPTAVDQQITLTYTRRPTGDCACDAMAIPDLTNDPCLTGAPGVTNVSDITSRLTAAYDWRKSFYGAIFDGVPTYYTDASASQITSLVEPDFQLMIRTLKDSSGNATALAEWDELWADFTKLASGTSGGTSSSSIAGEIVALGVINRVHQLRKSKISNLVIKDSAATPATLVLGTHYQIFNADIGEIKLLNVAGFTLPFRASYDYVSNVVRQRTFVKTNGLAISDLADLSGINVIDVRVTNPATNSIVPPASYTVFPGPGAISFNVDPTTLSGTPEVIVNEQFVSEVRGDRKGIFLREPVDGASLPNCVLYDENGIRVNTFSFSVEGITFIQVIAITSPAITEGLGKTFYADYNLNQSATRQRIYVDHNSGFASAIAGGGTFDASAYGERRLAWPSWRDKILSILGKFEASTVRGDGCWLDIGSEALYWRVVGSVGGEYAQAFNNRPYVSSRYNSTTKIYESTREFALQLNIKCTDKLREGDKITLSIGDAAWPATYQVGDTLSLSIIAAQDLFLSGGQSGTNLQTWYINGSVDGPRSPYIYDPAAPAPYSTSGLGFTLTPGTIPFAKSDEFKFGIEGGHYHWRKDGGVYSANLSIDTAVQSFTDGLTIQFLPGAAPSFAVSDLHKFRVLQPNRVSNLRRPSFDQWAWSGASATLEVDFGVVAPIDAIMLSYHTLPTSATITVEFATVAGVYGAPINLTWQANVIGKLLETPLSARYARLTISGAPFGRIGWLWLGSMLAAECCQGQVKVRYDYNIERAGLINGGAQAYGKTVSGEIKWDTGALTDTDRVNFVQMFDHVKLNHDQAVVIYPHFLHQDEAYLARILDDKIEIADWNLYHPNDKANRALSVTLPFEGVIL